MRQTNWHGLQGDVNYTWGHIVWVSPLRITTTSQEPSTSTPCVTFTSYTPTSFDLRHVTNAYGTYDLPFGKGKSFLSNGTLLNELVGGITIGTVITYKTGTPFKLTGGYNTYNNNDGGVTLTGRRRATAKRGRDSPYCGSHHVACLRSAVFLGWGNRRNLQPLSGGAEHDCWNDWECSLAARTTPIHPERVDLQS